MMLIVRDVNIVGMSNNNFDVGHTFALPKKKIVRNYFTAFLYKCGLLENSKIYSLGVKIVCLLVDFKQFICIVIVLMLKILLI
jgi:hypothetical protein